MSSSEMVSCVLFHGPTAQGRAAQAAADWGRVVGTFGDPVDGLNVETIRTAAAAMSAPVLGDVRGAVVVGPVDVLTQEGAVDALLKTLEEFTPRMSRPFLWAWDVGQVRPTVVSRCLSEWCPGQVVLDRDLVAAAKVVVDAALARSVVGVIEGFLEVSRPSGDEGPSSGKGSKDQWRDVGDEFLQAVARDLSRRQGSGHLWLWEQVRPVFQSRDTPSYVETLARFLP